MASVSCAGVWLARCRSPGRLAISRWAASASLPKVMTTRPASGKEARGRRPQALAAAGHQRHASVEHAHSLIHSPLNPLPP